MFLTRKTLHKGGAWLPLIPPLFSQDADNKLDNNDEHEMKSYNGL